MIVALFRRRLREGKSFADFKRAWEADQGFGVPTRVFNAVNLADERDVISIGFVAIEPEALDAGLARAGAQEQRRHSRIEEVVEATELRAMYRLVSEHDFSADPREIAPGSVESLLRSLSSSRDDQRST
jgi:hypothetical protein